MLLRIFKGTGPGVIFLIIIILIALWISAILNQRLHPRFIYETDPMPLYGLIKLMIHNSHNLGVVLSFLMVSLMAFLMVNFNTNVFFINVRTFLPALFYVMLGGFFPDQQLLNPVIPASIFLMVAIIRIMDGYHNTGTAYNYFDAGILISTGSLFYANLIWFGLLLIIGIALLRTGNLKEIVISIIGLLTPYAITFGIYYVIGRDVETLMKLVVNNLFTKSIYYHFQKVTIVALIFSTVLILVSLVHLINHMSAKKIKSRKTFSLMIWVFLISIIVYLALPSASIEIVWLTSIPVSYFLTHYFVFVKKKLVPEIFFSLFFVFILVIQIWYLR
ncbi:MAG: DUF6427 family protein [Bacteroidales bacterium]